MFLPKITDGQYPGFYGKVIAVANLQGGIGVTGLLVQPFWRMVNGLSVAGYKINLLRLYSPFFKCLQNQFPMKIADISI